MPDLMNRSDSKTKRAGLAVSLLAWLPALAVMGTIFFASAQPGDQVPLPEFVASDKLAHFCIYALLGLALGYRHRFARRLATEKPSRFDFLGLILGLAYGLSDEWHQTFVPGRQAGLDDWVADALGVAFGIVFSARTRGGKARRTGEP